MMVAILVKYAIVEEAVWTRAPSCMHCVVQNEDLTGVCIEWCADLADDGSTVAVIVNDPGVGLTSGDLREDLRAAQNHAC
jgi:hypothetical protein